MEMTNSYGLLLLVVVAACSSAETAAEPLHHVDTRDYFFTELERHPKVSVVRYGRKPDGAFDGQAVLWFMEQYAALAEARGYSHFVRLGIPEGSDHVIIGFVNTGEPDLAEEFPEHFDSDVQYRVLPSTYFHDMFADLPQPPSNKPLQQPAAASER